MQAQTHRFIYEVHIKKDSTSTERLKDNYIVDVNPDNVYYYNYSFYVADSMQKLNSNEGFPVPRDLNLYMHPSKKDKYVHYEMMGFNLFKMEQTDKQDWKLHTENKTFQDIIFKKQLPDGVDEIGLYGLRLIFLFRKDPISFMVCQV